MYAQASELRGWHRTRLLLQSAGAASELRNWLPAAAAVGLWDPYSDVHMGDCAELCAEHYQISREAMDDHAIEAFERARAAAPYTRCPVPLVAIKQYLQIMGKQQYERGLFSAFGDMTAACSSFSYNYHALHSSNCALHFCNGALYTAASVLITPCSMTVVTCLCVLFVAAFDVQGRGGACAAASQQG
jgi:hypothetical protein